MPTSSMIYRTKKDARNPVAKQSIDRQYNNKFPTASKKEQIPW